MVKMVTGAIKYSAAFQALSTSGFFKLYMQFKSNLYGENMLKMEQWWKKMTS